jgi:uncharacterized membrane protein
MTSHKKSMLKSVIWRVLGVLILGTITYIFTRRWITTTYITFFHHATFLLVYYLHERLWIALRRPLHWIKPWTYEIILGMGIGGLIVYIFTGSFSKVTYITGTYTVVKIITYYLYDRLYPKD